MTIPPTIAEYRAIMATRTRPLTDGHMSNARSKRERNEAAAIATTDPNADILEAMIANRQRRNSAAKVIPITSQRGRPRK